MRRASRKVAAFDPRGIRLGERFYSAADFDRIAAVAGRLPSGSIAVDVRIEDRWVRESRTRREALELELEHHAGIFATLSGFQGRPSPSEARDAFNVVARQAEALLECLGFAAGRQGLPKTIEDGLSKQAEAYGEEKNGYSDFPATRWTSGELSFIDYWGRAKLRQSVEDVGLLKQWAQRAAAAASKETSSEAPRHSGNPALDTWIAGLISIWRNIYLREPKTSVGTQGAKSEGIAGGPFLRFVDAALRPVLGRKTPGSDALRSRVRRLLKSAGKSGQSDALM